MELKKNRPTCANKANSHEEVDADTELPVAPEGDLRYGDNHAANDDRQVRGCRAEPHN